ncbi:MAG: DNA primase DnaG [Nanoarchaeota archaeon]
MAKVSPVSIKYMIYASFSAQGPVEKPDVIGAIFGQTEGLLGSDLEMRELQKEGKIGRIEVDLSVVDGKSVGEIRVPSALDKSETTIIAATLETIDRIGPTEAKIEVSKIEDVRGSKRDYIVERARKLLEGLDSSDGDMAKSVREESRVARIGEYGDDKLPCGDLSGEEIVVVEGRADVVNLIKNRVFNVIGMSGAKLSKDIARLGEEKELTLFVDGDRGGKLIAKNVIANANIAYVAVAPDGKEVEELQGKEILISLRKRWPAQEFMRRLGRNGDDEHTPAESAPVAELSREEVKKKVRELYAEIKDNKKAIFVDASFNIIQTVGATSALGSLMHSDTPVKAIIIDGSATSSLISACGEKGVTYLAARNFSHVEGTSVQLISL